MRERRVLGSSIMATISSISERGCVARWTRIEHCTASMIHVHIVNVPLVRNLRREPHLGEGEGES